MIKQSSARISHMNYEELLVCQSSITQMVRRKPFKYGRQILPIKEINKIVKQLDLDKNAKKIKFTNFFRSIFYALIVKRNSYSRTITSSGKSVIGQKFCQLGQVSHVAVLDRLNQYDEKKMDVLMVHILSKLEKGVRRTSQDTDRIRVIDGTSFALSYSRVEDEFSPMGPAKKATPVTKQRKINKGLMKLGLVIQAGNFIPIDWRFSDEYDDNQIFRDLVDWSKPGYTYLIDRGNVAVDYLKKFSDNKIYFIQKTWDSHTFTVLNERQLPCTRLVKKRFDLKREIFGWISRSDGIKLKVRRIISFDEKNQELLSLTTNDLDTSPRVIVKRHLRRWEIEVVIDWIKNTLGPDTSHKLTQWKKIKGLRNLIRIWFGILGILLAFAHKKYSSKWWQPQRFSIGEVIAGYEQLMVSWIEAKLGLRQHKSRIRW